MVTLYFKIITLIIAAASAQKSDPFSNAFNDGAFDGEFEKATLFRRKTYSQGNVYVPQISDLTERRCRYRDLPILYPPDLWVFLTSGACYFFSNSIRLTYPDLEVLFDIWTRDNETFPIPFVYHPLDDSQMFFNYKDTASVETYVSRLFNTRLSLIQWIQCCEDAAECCNNVLNNTNIMPSDEFPCPALWDGWSCVPQARTGETVKLWCPRFAYTGVENMCRMQTAEKYCLEEGDWNHVTNYGGCSTLPMLIRRHEFHVIALSVSIPFSLPAVFILLYFKKLRNLRLILINSLLMAIILKNVLTIISKEAVILDHLRTNDSEKLVYTVLATNSVECRILAYLENVSENFIFTMMLINAFYLHKTIVRVFRSDPNIYASFAIATVASLIPSTVWAILMGVDEIDECWMFEGDWYSWISNGYRYFVLFVNLLFLIDILRLLVLKRMKNNTRQIKSAIKGALFLLPLFGGQILLSSFLFLFNTSTCLVEDIFIYFTYLVEASQGILVAFLFCYFNNDVHKEVRNAYRKLNLVLQSRYGIQIRKGTDFNRTMAATTSADHTRTSVLNRDSVAESAVNNWLIDGGAPPISNSKSVTNDSSFT